MRMFSKFQVRITQMMLIMLISATLSGSLLWSCRDNEPSAEQPVTSLTAKEGLLVFKDVKAYEDIILLSGSKNNTLFQSALARVAGFVSLNKASARLGSNEPEIKNEFLQKILNQDGAVQIDRWVIKVDPKRDECRVLEAKNLTPDNYKDLIADKANPLVYRFPNNYDVLDLLAEGHTSVPKDLPNGRVSIFCGGGIGTRYDEKRGQNNYYYNTTSPNGGAVGNNVRFGARIDYAKFGIYFECDFFLERVGDTSPAPQVNSNITVQYTCDSYARTNCRNYWQVSCNRTNEPLILSENSPANGAGDYNFMRERFYQGSRGLKCLRARIKFDISGNLFGPTPAQESLQAEIADGGCQP